ncbi:LysM peptidoglycan-binding domain-containing protein [Lysinibacillus irui]|uniref:LysM peptidoglycan-binding domain-containing protein n=2 Tax=Lysinibacillus TaxID=400634 RepID=A0ABU5NM72_9BACI|nr:MULTISPECIES: LysM peptidoglycan-binding domain-containing protein [Lysinibacillus]MEA0555555.1 LysM peptidoglycan-binding domain-containing protein [Lysinibacillus irui]MEA0977140.1 LysM peptidoglycan-binding domain-containing protein [Lysinibacillus irui]MEA1043294.1 LysM peptidoglycan-binding domain-containing protein [Lysinibacillus irui]
MLIHVVSAGETLWQIANRYTVPVQTLSQLNALTTPDQLAIGQSLVIPSPYIIYTVRSGDTLWSIAHQFSVPVQSIVTANHLTNPDRITPGTKLLIPPIIHSVQPGETLWQIAQRYGTTIQAIAAENNITNPNMLYIGTHLIIPRKLPLIEVNAYSYQPSEEAIDSINAIGHLLTYFSPFAYMMKEDGTLQPINDEKMIMAAKANNIIPMLTLTNFTSTEEGSNLAHVVLSNADLQKKVMNNVLQVMQNKGYKVLNIDFENVLPADRENYNAFIQLAADTLHPKGYLVSTALAPKTSATQAGTLYEAQDYEAHGRIADFVVLMTYEWGYRFGPPQAISPINEMRRVVEYALTEMPADKILLGFELYARDWLLPHVKGQEAETFSPQEALDRAIKYGATIQFDPIAQSPFYRYVDEQGRNHEVWFEDARSAQAKFDMVKQYNLRGISYWALGFPFPQNWALLDNNFSIKKS